MRSGLALVLAALVLSASPSLHSQAEAPVPPAPVAKGKVERVKVHGPSLEGNLMGESASPEVSIYLPPSYATARNRRYPVVYFLHGYTGTDLSYFGPTGRQAHVRAEAAFAAGAREMILVTPNAMNAYGGSMYSNSVTAGNWEGYIAEDLVAYIDKTYRTIATRDARGLAGHSMGRYGTLRIGMKYPHVFSALYALSSCCLNAHLRDLRRRPRQPDPGAARAEGSAVLLEGPVVRGAPADPQLTQKGELVGSPGEADCALPFRAVENRVLRRACSRDAVA